MLRGDRVSELGIMEIRGLGPQATLQDLQVPFWPVVLERQLQRFGSTAKLVPGMPGVPHADLLVRVATGRNSTQQWLRATFGEQFRNVKNLAKGATSSAPTAEYIAHKAGIPREQFHETVRALFPTSRDQAELPAVVELLMFGEGFLYRIGTAFLKIPVPCPCCKANLLPSATAWWSQQSFDFAEPSHAFVDRILLDAFVFAFLRGDRSMSLWELSEPHAHPQANWLEGLRRLLGAPALKDLPVHAGAGDVTEDRVWAYARGENLPADVVERLVAKLNEPAPVKHGFTHVRAFTLAADLLQATSVGREISIETARHLVRARLLEFRRQVLVIIKHLEKQRQLRSAG
jgi:hypothetical protein